MKQQLHPRQVPRLRAANVLLTRRTKPALNAENQNPSVSIRRQRSHPRSKIPRRLLKANPGGDTPIHYLYGYVPPNVRGRGFEASDFLERGIHFRERGKIFRTHESFAIQFCKNTVQCVNKQTVVLLLCFRVQGGRILAQAASADSAILDK